MPEPSPPWPLMETTLGSTAAATAATEPGWRAGVTADEELCERVVEAEARAVPGVGREEHGTGAGGADDEAGGQGEGDALAGALHRGGGGRGRGGPGTRGRQAEDRLGRDGGLEERRRTGGGLLGGRRGRRDGGVGGGVGGGGPRRIGHESRVDDPA